MSSGIKKQPHIKRLPLAVALLGCLYGATAYAQEASDKNEQPAQSETPAPDQEKQPSKAEATTLDKVTVTGSLLKRVEYDSVSPVQVITADTNVALGQVSAAEFLQKSSIAAGSTQISNQFGGFVTEGGLGANTLSLRGLGANRTLVLVDGHRPGPSGTRGQVGPFNLNVLPSSIIQRIELLKDGSSSIYGSDAVAGVANVITRKNIDSPEISINVRAPFHMGGEVYQVSGATGWNFDNGSIVLAGEYFDQEPLQIKDRSFFRCPRDLVRDASGNIIDRVDRSTLAGTRLGGCSAGNLYANTVIDALTGLRYVPSWDGTTIGNIPGYRPRQNTTYLNSPQASYTDWLNFPFSGDAYIVDKLERSSIYAAADFSFGNVNWNAQTLFNRSTAEHKDFRQFFPLIVGRPGSHFVYANDPDYVNTSVPSGVSQPVMPMRLDGSAEVDYFYINTGLNGLFSFTDTWSWETNLSYTRSSGDYNQLSIDASKTGDWNYVEDAPTINYADPCYLSGACMDDLTSKIAIWDRGNTVYDQTVFNGVITGELFKVPAGAVGAAFGIEYRELSIDDRPGELSQAGMSWGLSSAQVTKGEDKVKEAFAEFEVPLLKGLPGVESLTLNASGRWFDYDSVAESDSVWKAGLGWQIVPSLRVRATKGTSYRAPGLFELYLGNQSSFLPQTAIDPCINWGEKTNTNLRANCAAAGVPEDYVGASTSATVFQGGGAGFLDPEHSDSITYGLVWTPTFAPISVALDYFEITVNDQIGELGASTIVGSCYGSAVYPNNFCSMFTRTPASAGVEPNKIDNIFATYVNINKQKVSGYDLLMRYEDDLSIGSLTVESQITYTKENVFQLFDSPLEGGSTVSDFVGDIGSPKLVGNLTAQLRRGDWTYTYGLNYTGSTKVLEPSFASGDNYFGRTDTIVDTRAESRIYHSASVKYDQPKWSALVGISNILDTKPGELSGGNKNLYGNVPVSATQYDYFGTSLFVQMDYKF